MTFPDRVAKRASSFTPTRILLTVLAAPFYVVGFVLGVVWVAVSWAWAAVLVGIGDVKARGSDAG